MKEAENKHGWLLLLRKWLRGDATHTDEAELETRARTDEFLAEAIEGYREFPDDDHQWHLDNIRQRLCRKKNKRPQVLIYLPKVAAAVLVVAVAGWTLMTLVNRHDAELAQADEKISAQPPNETTLKFYDAQEISPSENEALAPAEHPLAEPASSPSVNSATKNTDTSTNIASESSASNYDTPAGPAPESTLLMPTSPSIPNRTVADAPALNTNEAADMPVPAQFVLKGKVVDAATGEPLIAAAVQVLGANVGAVTDLNGNFSIPFSEENARLLISYTGYQNAEVSVSLQNPVTVQLQPATDALNEVVIVGKKTTKTKEATSAAGTVAADNPAPKGGWKKWERYLRSKMKYPEEARAQGVKGEVTLRFVIDKAGKPTRISVAKGLGSGCDEEAIRLLQNGPQWHPPGPAAVSIKFE